MATIYKPTRKLPDGTRVKYKTYRIVYIDETGRRRTAKGFKDKAATEARARELERDAERARAGLPTASRGKLEAPIEEALEQYLEDIKRQGLSKERYKAAKNTLKRLIKGCDWKCLKAIRPSNFTKFLAAQDHAGKAPSTLNSYHEHLNTFIRWCQDQNWMVENPIATVRKTKANGNKPFRRRAYTLDEFKALVQAPRFEYAVDAYMIAALSGLRKLEIKRLERRDVDLEHCPPLWRLRKEATKNRLGGVLPVMPELVPLLRRLCEGKAPKEKLLPTVPTDQTVSAHIAKAKIAKVDAEGRWVNFHSLRYFFCTALAKTLPIQIVRKLMRHATIQRTCDLYMDLGLADTMEAIAELPAVLNPPARGGAALDQPQPTKGED